MYKYYDIANYECNYAFYECTCCYYEESWPPARPRGATWPWARRGQANMYDIPNSCMIRIICKACIYFYNTYNMYGITVYMCTRSPGPGLGPDAAALARRGLEAASNNDSSNDSNTNSNKTTADNNK